MIHVTYIQHYYSMTMTYWHIGILAYWHITYWHMTPTCCLGPKCFKLIDTIIHHIHYNDAYYYVTCATYLLPGSEMLQTKCLFMYHNNRHNYTPYTL
jgi:hypothetical protein